MLISIITINYNNILGLKKTINSIEEQTYQDFEYVIVDGCSSDGGIDIIKSNKIVSKWVSEKDNGVYHAMNKGIKLANGEYVIFMNSGDVFYDNEVLKDFISDLNEGHDLIYGNSWVFNDDGFLYESEPPESLSFAFFKDSTINHQAAFIRKQLFYDTFFYNENYKICSDWDFFIRNVCLNRITYKKNNRLVVRYDWTGLSAQPENYQIYLDERKATLTKYFNIPYELPVIPPPNMPYLVSLYDKNLESIHDRRIEQFVFLKDYKIAWKIVKGVMNFNMFFIARRRFNEFSRDKNNKINLKLESGANK